MVCLAKKKKKKKKSRGGHPGFSVLMSRTVSVDVKQHSAEIGSTRVQELCESRSGRPGLFVLTSLTVSVDVKQHWTVLRHW